MKVWISIVLLTCLLSVAFSSGNESPTKEKEEVIHFEKGDKESLCLRICPRIYSPVCGSDGVTYGNSCEMETEACSISKTISVNHWGEC